MHTNECFERFSVEFSFNVKAFEEISSSFHTEKCFVAKTLALF